MGISITTTNVECHVTEGKGDGVPEDAVESMVEVHNFLNEGAWQQILTWEDQYTQQTKVEPRLKKVHW